MSIESVAIALHHSQASGTAKLVLIGIANHDGDAGSFPKTATLARYANVHPRRIPEAVAKLVELGEVKVYIKDGGTTRGPRAVRAEVAPNLYEITLACPPNCDGTSRHVLLSPDGQALKFGRSYQGAYTGPREKDPEAVERGKRSWAKRNGEAVDPVDNGAQEAAQEAPGPSDENSTSDGNSTRSSDGNSTRPSDGNSTTKNLPTNHTMNPALVPTSPGNGAAVENSGTLRELVPALPRVAAPGYDATNGKTDPLGLTVEQMSRNRHGAAMARAALRGELATKEAVDVA